MVWLNRKVGRKYRLYITRHGVDTLCFRRISIGSLSEKIIKKLLKNNHDKFRKSKNTQQTKQTVEPWGWNRGTRYKFVAQRVTNLYLSLYLPSYLVLSLSSFTRYARSGPVLPLPALAPCQRKLYSGRMESVVWCCHCGSRNSGTSRQAMCKVKFSSY